MFRRAILTLTYDLLYSPDLASPTNWHFLMRCLTTNACPSATNVIARGLCEPQGFFALTQTNGNLTVKTNVTPQQMAQLLVPPWVSVTNAKYTGANVACGTFAGGYGCGLPIDSGVILSTGYITNAIGPNSDDGWNGGYYGPSNLGQQGDDDLDSLVGSGGNTKDAAVLEFDIVWTNSFTLQFQYIFASEEYPEYDGNLYDDPMAIFVSTNRVGTNWINSIATDIALVPGTTNVPVAVNTINGGYAGTGAQPTNSQYYVDNGDPLKSTNAPVFNIQYDGTTVLLTAQTLISANVTNHVKIGIADYWDPIYDSAVFIKPWSPCPCQ